MRRAWSWLLCGFLCLPLTVFAKTAFPISGNAVSGYSRFDTEMSALLRKWQLAGASVAVIKKGQILYSRGFGYSNLSKKTPVQPDSEFRVASISKAITASAVLSLVDQNKLKLSDSAYNLLGISPLPGRAVNPAVYKITVAQLLYMTSGWSRWFDPLFGPWPSDDVRQIGAANLPLTCENAARYMMSEPLANTPGSTFVYANINYCLLGLVVAKVSGMPYVQYVNSHIMAPLGVQDMHLANTQMGQQDPREVTYYPLVNPGPSNPTPDSVPIMGLPYGDNQLLFKNSSDGGWVATAPDLARWADALRRGKIINPKLVAMMTSPPPTFKPKKDKKGVVSTWPYGMGWFLPQTGQKPIIYTHGSFTGTNGIIFWRPDGTTLVALFNQKPNSYAGVQAVRNQVRSLFVKYVP